MRAMVNITLASYFRQTPIDNAYVFAVEQILDNKFSSDLISGYIGLAPFASK